MGSFSLWHWLIVLFLLGVPLIIILARAPVGPNRFGEQPLPMNFGEAIASFFKNYVNFTERASRSEFWYAALFNLIVNVCLGLVDQTDVASGIWSLATFLPTIAISARRLHDINRSGWHQLLSFLFPIGTIAVLVWYCKPASDTDQTTVNTSAAPTNLDSVEVLERLAKLKASGAITQEEYDAEKRKILKI